MKITATDLYLHLFEQLERLNDQELTTEQLEAEVRRTRAMTDVSKQIIDLAKEEARFLRDTSEATRTKSRFFTKPARLIGPAADADAEQ